MPETHVATQESGAALKRTSITIEPKLFEKAEKRRKEKFDRNFALYVSRLIAEDVERGAREQMPVSH